MNLTEDQRLQLAQRIYNEFKSFVTSELEYQVEAMKDNDELDWNYYIQQSDADIIKELLIDLIRVPVS